MKKDFVEYLPYITGILLIFAAFVIYDRGGFEKEGVVPTLPSEVTQTDSPILTPTVESLSTKAPVPTPQINSTDTPVPLGTIPSIQRIRSGDDD